MKKTVWRSLQIGTDQAAQALHLLISDGRITAREVRAVIARREKTVREIRERLAALGAEGLNVLAAVRRETRGVRKLQRKAKGRISAARRAAMKVQGQYMAAVRRLPKTGRAKIKALREKSGVKAAIAAAKRMSR